MGVKSLGNALASFGYKFGTTGLEASSPNETPPVNLTASGGNVINTYTVDGVGYKAHTFTSSGSFVISSSGNVTTTYDVLVLGGGGGGGDGAGRTGGGGAGALKFLPQPVSPGTSSVTIGAGGAGPQSGEDGSPSSFASITLSLIHISEPTRPY